MGMSKRNRDIRTIIDDAGGPKKIAEATEGSKRKIMAKSVYDWPRIGIPELHWSIIIRLAKATTDELHRANEVARAARPTMPKAA